MKEIKECLEARKRTIESHLENRKNHKLDFSDWGCYDKKELEGRLDEINNTLNMINHSYKITKEGV